VKIEYLVYTMLVNGWVKNEIAYGPPMGNKSVSIKGDNLYIKKYYLPCIGLFFFNKPVPVEWMV
jgi:hypothetical protein